MRCLKAVGERIAARLPDSEIHICLPLTNRFSALAATETFA